MVKNSCLNCKKDFVSYASAKKKYCSLECRPCNYWLGKNLSQEHKEKLSVIKKNNPPTYWLGKKRPLSQYTKNKMSLSRLGKPKSLSHRLAMSECKKGEKSYNWKGGITPINEKIRNSLESRLWRETVFKRDDWTCQTCGIRGGNLQAHHIKVFAYYPELRFELSNGRTLCRECHKKTDTYGYKATKILVFIN